MQVIIENNKEINKQITCKVTTKHCPVISPSSPCTPLSVCVTVITLSTVLSCPPFAASFISHTFLQVAKLFRKQFLLRIVWAYMNLFSAAYPPAFRHPSCVLRETPQCHLSASSGSCSSLQGHSPGRKNIPSPPLSQFPLQSKPPSHPSN